MTINCKKVAGSLLVCFAAILFLFQPGHADNSCDLLAFEANCSIGCPRGYEYEGGCPVCECADYPVELLENCSAVWPCATKCDNYAIDDNGCVTCQCDSTTEAVAEKAQCDLLAFEANCSIGCPRGYKYEGGCPVCECADYPVELLENCSAVWPCDTKCENYVIDDNGCVTCQCDATTEAVAEKAQCDLLAFEANCSIGCPQGYKYEGGCPVCECADYPVELLENCLAVWPCATKCENYVIDDNGCVTCQCDATT